MVEISIYYNENWRNSSAHRAINLLRERNISYELIKPSSKKKPKGKYICYLFPNFYYHNYYIHYMYSTLFLFMCDVFRWTNATAFDGEQFVNTSIYSDGWFYRAVPEHNSDVYMEEKIVGFCVYEEDLCSNGENLPNEATLREYGEYYKNNIFKISKWKNNPNPALDVKLLKKQWRNLKPLNFQEQKTRWGWNPQLLQSVGM